MFYTQESQKIIISVKIMPNAGENAVKGVFVSVEQKEYLRIAITTVPEKGKANKDLIKFLSKKLDISKSQIEILSGETSHFKKIALDGKSQTDEIIKHLEEWSQI